MELWSFSPFAPSFLHFSLNSSSTLLASVSRTSHFTSLSTGSSVWYIHQVCSNFTLLSLRPFF
ncbi:hypothetical protein CLU79DRAFT_747314 [Phycomyces nitens]|nr:hypothetical protein CLU79DRAFT_747314 [Phycomyces nitens]